MPSNHSQAVAEYCEADESLTKDAIKGALKVKERWETLPFADRAAVFLKAADLLSTKYRYEVPLNYAIFGDLIVVLPKKFMPNNRVIIPRELLIGWSTVHWKDSFWRWHPSISPLLVGI